MDRLELLVEALVRTLESKGVLDLDAVKAEIKNLDLADGALDGRMGTGILRRYEE